MVIVTNSVGTVRRALGKITSAGIVFFGFLAVFFVSAPSASTNTGLSLSSTVAHADIPYSEASYYSEAGYDPSCIDGSCSVGFPVGDGCGCGGSSGGSDDSG